jgi:acetyl esterase
MPVLPELQPMLDSGLSIPVVRPTDDVPAARAALTSMLGEMIGGVVERGPELADVADHDVPVEGGSIRVRIYRPSDDSGLPVHAYLHGGGWWVLGLDAVDDRCRHLAAASGCAVASIEYRLAPEHRFPTGLEDAYTAVVWLVEHADELGLDPKSCSVGGDSSGGNLAVVVAMLARDRGGPELVFQIIEQPLLDLTLGSPSMTDFSDGYVFSRESVAAMVELYLADPADARNPLASPLFADRFEGLPPALVAVCEYDPMRDDGTRYAECLRDAGVDVRLVCSEGHVHGSTTFTLLLESAREYEAMVASTLAAAHRST